MNETEKKTKAKFEVLLERDHGVNRQQDRELIDGLWAISDEMDRNWADDSQTGLRDLVDTATQSKLFGHYMGFKRGEPRAGDGDVDVIGSVGPSKPLLFDEGEVPDESEASDGTLKATTRSRLAALSEYLSRIVATDKSVVLFRTRVLGGPTKTLPPAEATQLIQRLATEQQAGPQRDAGTLWWSGNDASPRAEPIPVWRGSELWNLQDICNRLARRYSWAQDQVCYLILTGEPIAVNVLKGKTATRSTGVAAHRYNSATIILEVEAWVPSEYVRQAYHNAQRNHHGENNRQPKLRNVKVFQFVLTHSKLDIVSEKEGLAKLTIPHPWKVLRNLWNERYPETHEWHYHKKTAKEPKTKAKGRPVRLLEHHFSRDFYRGQEAVIGTPHGLPGIPNQPMTAAEATSSVEEMVERLSQAVERGAAFTQVDSPVD